MQGINPFTCKTCGKGLSSEARLIEHQRIHTGESPFPCTWEGCKEAFANSTSLNRHFMRHYDMPVPPRKIMVDGKYQFKHQIPRNSHLSR